jgi:hypothetical protein
MKFGAELGDSKIYGIGKMTNGQEGGFGASL